MKSSLLLGLLAICFVAVVSAMPVDWQQDIGEGQQIRPQCGVNTVAMAIPPAHRRFWSVNPLTRNMKFSGPHQEYLCVDRAKLGVIRREIMRLGLAQKKNLDIDPAQLVQKTPQQTQMEIQSGNEMDQLDERFYLTREFDAFDQQMIRQLNTVDRDLESDFDQNGEEPLTRDLMESDFMTQGRGFGFGRGFGWGGFGRFGGLGFGRFGGFGLGLGLGVPLGVGYGLGLGYGGFGYPAYGGWGLGLAYPAVGIGYGLW